MNGMLFENRLSDCMLIFSRRRSSSHTLFTAGQWCLETGSATPEISLNVKQLSECEPIEAMATLVRQMVNRASVAGRVWETRLQRVLQPGMDGLGLICECGNVFVEEKGIVKPGPMDKIYGIFRSDLVNKENSTEKMPDNRKRR